MLRSNVSIDDMEAVSPFNSGLENVLVCVTGFSPLSLSGPASLSS